MVLVLSTFISTLIIQVIQIIATINSGSFATQIMAPGGGILPGLGKKVIIGFLLFVATWNLTKLPFYVSFNNDGDVAYNSHGVELSINLGHWLKVRY
jgi:hypothetical protein